MKQYSIRIEVEQGEIESIMHDLCEAQEKISECYNRLIELGVVKIRDEAANNK